MPRLFFSLQEELVRSATFRYITDAITRDEALAILKAKEATKDQREAIVRSQGCVWRWDAACRPSFFINSTTKIPRLRDVCRMARSHR
jgi:hypothetical protein